MTVILQMIRITCKKYYQKWNLFGWVCSKDDGALRKPHHHPHPAMKLWVGVWIIGLETTQAHTSTLARLQSLIWICHNQTADLWLGCDMLAIRVCSSVYLNYESRYSDAVFHPVGKIKLCQWSRLLINNHVLLVTNYIFQTKVSKYCSCFCLVIEIMPTGWIDGWWNLEANRLVLRRSSRVTRPPRALIMCHILYEMGCVTIFVLIWTRCQQV